MQLGTIQWLIKKGITEAERTKPQAEASPVCKATHPGWTKEPWKRVEKRGWGNEDKKSPMNGELLAWKVQEKNATKLHHFSSWPRVATIWDSTKFNIYKYFQNKHFALVAVVEVHHEVITSWHTYSYDGAIQEYTTDGADWGILPVSEYGTPNPACTWSVTPSHFTEDCWSTQSALNHGLCYKVTLPIPLGKSPNHFNIQGKTLFSLGHQLSEKITSPQTWSTPSKANVIWYLPIVLN